MSPLQRTITMPVLLAGSIFIAVFFAGCSDKIKTEINVFKALDEGLVNSNIAIQRGSEQLYFSLEDKLSDPSTVEKAKIWQSKAMLIKTLSANTITYIEGLKSDLKKEAGLKADEGAELFREADKNAVIRLFDKNGKGKELYERLKNYKTDVLAIDSDMSHAFGNTLLVIAPAFESSENKQQDFAKTFFDDIPAIAALAMLSKFQNNTKVIENKTVSFCNNKVANFTHGYTTNVAIAFQNSSYVKAGEQVEIAAGIVSTDRASKPEVIVQGKNVDMGYDGLAIYKFKASSKTGKHTVPVEINFTDQEGKKQTITKIIEYTVAQK